MKLEKTEIGNDGYEIIPVINYPNYLHFHQLILFFLQPNLKHY
jgi:hypothetical protein